MVQLAEVKKCHAASIAYGHLTEERYVVHAPQHAAVRGLGQDQLLRAQIAERCRRQALAAKFPLDHSGEKHQATAPTTSGEDQATPALDVVQQASIITRTPRRPAARPDVTPGSGGELPLCPFVVEQCERRTHGRTI